MAALRSRSPSLGVLVEQAYGECPGTTVVRGLVNWRRCRDILFTREAPAKAIKKFRAELKVSQQKSAIVLFEWWCCAYHEPEIIKACQQRLKESAARILQGTKPPRAAASQGETLDPPVHESTANPLFYTA
jgi:hypothetical protein